MEKEIKNAQILGEKNLPFSTNDPTGEGRHPQLYAWQTASFYQRQAPYATDYFQCTSQGVNPDNFYAYYPCNIRLSDILNPSAGSNLIEDYKLAIWADPPLNFISLGAKVNVGKNIYLVSNPSNQSSVLASAVLRRCNAYYNFLDYYGNILHEPFVWTKENIRANQNQFQDNMVLVGGHQQCIMQINPNTRNVSHNTRMILGSQAYQVTGLVDFLKEFTNDGESEHLMMFDLHQVEPNANDDMNNQVAGGLSFQWEILIDGLPTMAQNTSYLFSAASIRNGETPTREVSYLWESSNTQVATVDSNGEVRAVSPGDCVITCTLSQNTNIQTNFPLSVSEQVESYISFGDQLSDKIGQFQSAMITACVYENGAPSAVNVEWSLSGPDESCYASQVNGNTISITCYFPSSIPLIVEASYQDMKAKTQVQLEGY